MQDMMGETTNMSLKPKDTVSVGDIANADEVGDQIKEMMNEKDIKTCDCSFDIHDP